MFFNKKPPLFTAYVITVLLLTTLPLNSAGELNNIYVLNLRGDYFFHALMFIPWAFFKDTTLKTTWVWLLLGLILATGTEGIQYLLPYRTYNINDLLANSIGILLGFILYFTYQKASQIFPKK